MNIKFSVPEFPAFKGNLDTVDYRRYGEHVKRFENFAAFVVKAQIDIAEKAVEKGYLKDELVVLKDSIRGMNEAATHCVEKSSMIVESELSQVKEQIALEVAKLSRQYDEECACSSAADPVVVVNVADDPGVSRGPNWERNIRNREVRKLRKLARQNAGFDWRKGAAIGASRSHANRASRVVDRGEQANDLKVDGNKLTSEGSVGGLSCGQVGRNGKPIKDSQGFWKSCSDDVRQQLIDSKARMHIAENERKTREAEKRVAYLDSPQAIVDEVTRMITKAEALAQKQGDEKIVGWAKTVTNSSAESLARSAPSSVPSFESVSDSVNEAVKLSEMRRESETKEIIEKLHARIAQLERERESSVPTEGHKSKKAERPVPPVLVRPVRREGESGQDFFLRTRKFKEMASKLGMADSFSYL